MKKLVLISAMLLFVGSSYSVFAQAGQGSDTACVGLKNPLNFWMSGGHNELWTGYTGSKPETASTCYVEGVSCGTTVQADALESVNNSDGCSISLTYTTRPTTSASLSSKDPAMTPTPITT